ncbi:chromate resistance protein ChrB domain-containing protein [Pararhizobium antarcticum]|uniref:Sulfurtransferase n=1 Tax=Pararhizobium antarcticum TaxID=1798805 RepID=A0A657LX78_9HYPH|nr:sulfurtransferase/chromate resistance protein [Pararhizobium antarcticum]OJF90376.1 sulfurtransferase [Rhizobium sp. 58]OJG00562.1 sulfurtransferase [Pararhizobium antarcticum]
MASYNSISIEKLARLIGTPNAPVIIDVRDDGDFDAGHALLPSSIRLPYATVRDWAGEYRGRWVVILCQKGKKLSEGVAAWLRNAGASAEILEGGFSAWQVAGLPLVPVAAIPGAVSTGGTVWVTRSRPKIDRIACPWLLRRFVDPKATILFVASSEVEAVAERFGAMPFDIEGVFWSHRGEGCTFDTMISEFGLFFPALQRLALIVRAADTDSLDLVPEASGLLAASLGLSRMFADDLEQLEAGMLLYDAFYRWARDATREKHEWVSHVPKKGNKDA